MKKLLTFIMLLVSVFAVFAVASTSEVEAAAPEKLYLTPNSNWKVDNARFAAYFFGNGETWVSMTKVEGETDLYEVAVPAGYPNVIFCRMNPSATANNWNNKWNQTADLTVPTNGQNHYTVKAGSWDKGGGTWAVYTPAGEEPVELEPWQELQGLFEPFYNGGYYVRNTEINLDMTDEEVRTDLYNAFHAHSLETSRTTYFYPNELWMTNDNGVNSGYADNAEGMMYNFSYVNGEKHVNYTTNIAGTEAYYTTLADIKVTEAQGWTKENNVYKSSDAALIEQFLAFTAPCFLNINESNENVFTLSYVTMQVVDKKLVMQLHVSEDSNGFIKDGSSVLSTAEITNPTRYSIKGSLYNNWADHVIFKHTDLEGFLAVEMDLTAGSYEFKYLVDESWYGNDGTINDTTESFGWLFEASQNANCKLTALGGHYVFKLEAVTNKIEVYKIAA